MNKYINICAIYTMLWCIYNLHLLEVLPSTNFIISKIPLAINLLISLYLFIKVNLYRVKPSIFNALNILILMFVIYGTLSIVSGKEIYVTAVGKTINNASYVVSILRSLLPIYAFYYFCRKGYINDINIRWYAIILILIYISYYYIKTLTNSEVLGVDSGETTNNIGYAIVSLLPCLALFANRKIIFYGGLSIIIFVVLMCMKRGAILIGVLLSIILMYNAYRASKRAGRIITIFASCILIFVVLNYIENLYSQNEYFQRRIEATIEGNSSGRDNLAEMLINSYVYEANFPQLLFGRGADSTVEIAGNYAHNDWLEILTNQGIIGVIISLIYWVNYWKEIRSMRCKSNYRYILTLIFIIYFLSTFFSMSYNQVTTVAALLMGYCLYYGHHKSNIIN